MVSQEEFDKLKKRVLELEKTVLNLLSQKVNEIFIDNESFKKTIRTLNGKEE